MSLEAARKRAEEQKAPDIVWDCFVNWSATLKWIDDRAASG
jgi:hypothetical protein